MADITWLIRTKSNGEFPARFDLSGPSELNRGGGATFTFEFGGSLTDDLVVSGSYTIESGEAEMYDNVTVQSGATLTIDGLLRCDTVTSDGTVTVNGELIVSDGGYSAFNSYREWAGKYTMSEMLDGTNKYKTQIPTSENIDTLVVGIEPSEDLKNREITGIWGIIDTISDERDKSLSTNRYRFDVTVLGEYSDYNDHTDIETNLQL